MSPADDKGILDQLKKNNLDGGLPLPPGPTGRYDGGSLDGCVCVCVCPDLRAAVAKRGNSFYQKTCHFTSNHDEPRAAAALGGDQQGFIGTVITSTLPGARMFYFGCVQSYSVQVEWHANHDCVHVSCFSQFQGFTDRLLVQLRRETYQPNNNTVWGLYDKLLDIISDPVFHHGTWNNIDTPLSGTAWRLVAWRWAFGDEKRLVVVNFSNEQGWGQIVVPDASAPAGQNLTLTELFTGVEYNRSATKMRTSGSCAGCER